MVIIGPQYFKTASIKIKTKLYSDRSLDWFSSRILVFILYEGFMCRGKSLKYNSLIIMITSEEWGKWVS